MPTPTPPEPKAPEEHIHQTLNDIKILWATNPHCAATNDMLHRFAFLLSKLSEVSSNNAAKQEGIALESNKLTKENLQLQSKVVNLTWALFVLTFVLTLVAGIQIYYLVKGSTP